MEQRTFWESIFSQGFNRFPHFVETKLPLPRSHQYASWPRPDPDKCNPQLFFLFLSLEYISVLAFSVIYAPVFQVVSVLPVSTKTLQTFPFNACRVHRPAHPPLFYQPNSIWQARITKSYRVIFSVVLLRPLHYIRMICSVQAALDTHFWHICPEKFCIMYVYINPYPTAFPYGNGMVLHFYQQQENSTTKTVHKVINKGLKAYV